VIGIGVGGLVFLLLIGVIGVTLANSFPDPDDVVDEYLTAVKQRDIDKAIDVAGVARPSGEQARFLTPDALDSDWEIRSVRTESETDSVAQVTAVIARSDDVSVWGSFKLSHKDDRWRIDNPWSEMKLVAGTLSYLDINKVVVPRRGDGDLTYLMLPGLYHFYQTPSEVVEIRPETTSAGVASVLLLPHPHGIRGPWRAPRSVTVTATKAGHDIVDRTVRGHIDECVKREVLRPLFCPFGLSRGELLRITEGSQEGTQVTSGNWKVVRYPTIVLVPKEIGFDIRLKDGVVRFSGIKQEPDGKRVSVSIVCKISTGSRSDQTGYQATITTPKILTVVRPETSDGRCY